MKLVLLVLATVFATGQIYAAPCSSSDVMRTLHQNTKYKKFKYASNWQGESEEEGEPTLKAHHGNDQYVFWIDDNGNTCPAVVAYKPGKCSNGMGVVRMDQCE